MNLSEAAQRLGSTLLFWIHQRPLLAQASVYAEKEELDTSDERLFDLIAEAVAIIHRGRK